MSKIISFEDLAQLHSKHPGKKIVHCHGVFDLFHFGHLSHLQSAKAFGDILVVTVTANRYVNKGPHRPHYNEEKRMAMLASLEIVDYVALSPFSTAIKVIETLRPDFFVKGPDYRDKEKDITGGILEEERVVESCGGKLVFTEDETESSSHLLNQFFNSWDEDQRGMIENIKSLMPIDSVVKEIEAIRDLKILVVGEPIIDTYVFCKAENLSSKSPTVAANYLYHEDFAGGSWAIASHLAALGAQVSLLIPHGGDAESQHLNRLVRQRNVKLIEVFTPNSPTPKKTRYLTPFKSQRIFELQNVAADLWVKNDPSIFLQEVKALSSKMDLTIVADFGHGLFEGPVLHEIQKDPSFLALNVQTNSGNYGFNTFTKYERYDYLSIDERECRLALSDRTSSIEDLAHKVAHHFDDRLTAVTLGARGSLFFDLEGEKHFSPTFFKEVVDSTGAGDAFFAITSALVRMETPPQLIPFVGNCYAGLQAMTLCNKSPVSHIDLVRTVSSLLK